MAQESRVKKSLLNARVNLIFYFLTLALSFFSRKIFLDCLGADFVGLTGTLQNLLGFLNLAELGIGSAIGYVLYKPLFDHDEAKINEIISVFGYLYRWIGRIILGAGCILACFLPLIFPDTQFELGIIFFAYFAFLASSLIGYFANYKQTLLGADQKNYVVTAYFQTANIVKVLIQMASAYYTGSYYLWVVIELAFGIIYSFILNWKINQVYPWLKSEVKQGKLLFKQYPEVMRYTKQLFIQKITWLIRFQSQNILIYSFTSLKLVAYYGNYSIIFEKLLIFSGNIFNSVSASIGNLIAENNKEKIQKIYWELYSIRFIFTATLAFSLYMLTPLFISFWLGDKYILSQKILIIMVASLFLDQIRSITDQFLFGYGLFYDIWASLSEAIISITISLIFGHIYGIEGVLCGNIIGNLLIAQIWKPIFLYSKGFKCKIKSYYTNIFPYYISIIISIFLSHYLITSLVDYPQNILSWIIYALICVIIYSSILIILLCAFTKHTKSIFSNFIKLINKKQC